MLSLTRNNQKHNQEVEKFCKRNITCHKCFKYLSEDIILSMKLSNILVNLK